MRTRYRYCRGTAVVLVLLAGLLGLRGVSASADQLGGAATTGIDEVVSVRGLIESVADDGSIAVRSAKGERVVVSVGPETVLDGMRRIDELERKRQVKIWYTVFDGRRDAVRIELIPDLGC